ncbi:peptidase family C50 [Colletotrichum asianum]
MGFWPPNLGLLGRQTKRSIEGDYKRSSEETRDTVAVDSVTPNGWVLVAKPTPPASPSFHPQMSDAPDVPPEKAQGENDDAKVWTEEEIYDLHRVSTANVAGLRRVLQSSRRNTMARMNRFVNFCGLYCLGDNRIALCIVKLQAGLSPAVFRLDGEEELFSLQRGHEELMDIIEAAKVIRDKLDEPSPGRRIFLHEGHGRPPSS